MHDNNNMASITKSRCIYIEVVSRNKSVLLLTNHDVKYPKSLFNKRREFLFLDESLSVEPYNSITKCIMHKLLINISYFCLKVLVEK